MVSYGTGLSAAEGGKDSQKLVLRREILGDRDKNKFSRVIKVDS